MTWGWKTSNKMAGIILLFFPFQFYWDNWHIALYKLKIHKIMIWLRCYTICYCVFAHFHGIMRGFPGDPVVKNLPSNAEDTENMGLIPGSGRSPGVGNGNSLQYSCLENSKDNWASEQSRTRPGTITAPGEPYKVKNTPSQYVGGSTDGKLKGWGRRWSSPPPHFPLDY